MARLDLVKTTDGKYFVQGTGDPSRNADFSLFDLDGEGGDPFAFGSIEFEIVPGIDSADYDANDSDTFYSALAEVLKSAMDQGIDVPDYVRNTLEL